MLTDDEVDAATAAADEAVERMSALPATNLSEVSARLALLAERLREDASPQPSDFELLNLGLLDRCVADLMLLSVRQ